MRVLGRGELSGEMLWEAFDRRVLEPVATIVSDIVFKRRAPRRSASQVRRILAAGVEIHHVRSPRHWCSLACPPAPTAALSLPATWPRLSEQLLMLRATG